MGYIEGLLSSNERIVIRTRQHLLVLVSSFLRNLVLALIIVFLAVLLIAGSSFTSFRFGMFGLLPLILLIFPVVSFLRTYLDWWNEEYLVTNRRVIQAEGVINKHVIDSSLEKVNDVVLNQSFLGRLFDYGDIEIMTASEIGVNRLNKIARPVKFKTEMLNQKEAMGTDEHFVSPAGRKGSDIPSLIAELDELRKQGVLTEAEFQQKKAQLLSKM